MLNGYSKIIEIIEPRSTVLDIGCGTGELLRALVEQKHVMGRGVEINENNILACVEKGISVTQSNIDEGLHDYLDNSFDYVILSQTLQVVHNPLLVMQEMLRVGKKGLVTIPNFGHWEMRLKILFTGRMPKSDTLPYDWYDTPNIHVGTMRDFKKLCHMKGIRILKEYPIPSLPSFIPGTSMLSNLFACGGLFLIASES